MLPFEGRNFWLHRIGSLLKPEGCGFFGAFVMKRVRFAGTAPAILTAIVLLAGCSSGPGTTDAYRAPEPRFQQAAAVRAAGADDQKRTALSYTFAVGVS
jgi:hypothetical protein